MINENVEFLLTSSHYLRSFAHSLPGSDIYLYNRLDYEFDTDMDDVRFRTWFCNDVTDPIEAWRIGTELTLLLNGAVNIFYDYYRSFKIDSVIIDGALVPKPDKLQLEPFLLHKLCKRVTPPAEQANLARGSRITHAIHQAKTDKGVYILLRLFSMEMNWETLYKILETLEKVMRDDNFTSPISSNKRKAFTKSANNFSLTNFSSRHGYVSDEELGDLELSRAMEVDEAIDLLTKATRSYLIFLLDKSPS